MDVSSCLSMTSDVSLNPLREASNIAALKTFEKIIKTCIGPCGKLKIVQNSSGGHVTITSSSQKLLYLISIQNTFLKLIVSSTKVHLNRFNNCGLCCCLLTLKLVNNSLSGTYPLPLNGKLIEFFGKIFMDSLNEEKNSCILKMDLSSLTHVQSVVQSIILSKPGCILKEEDVRHLTFLLLKAHLNCIPSSTAPSYHKNINFISLEGTSCDKSCLYEGLLIKLCEIPLKNFNFQNELNLKIVLFTTSLSGDADFPVDNIEVTNGISIWDAVLKFMKNVIEKIIENGIHILACQKVVHPSLRKQLENANILVLDRLGHETSKHLEYLSGSSNSSFFDKPVFGYITSINKVTIGKKDFLVLSNDSKPFYTLLICNFNEQAVNETKVVCHQVVDTLFRLLRNPTVCFGAGCTEVHTSKLVEQQVISNLDDVQKETGCTTSQILEALQIFMQSVTDLATAIHQDSYLNFITENVYGHLWRLNDGNFPSNSDRCMCGQFSASGINNSDWKVFTRSVNTHVESVNFHPEGTKEIETAVILDEISSKINAYSLAFETGSLLLRVSACVRS